MAKCLYLRHFEVLFKTSAHLIRITVSLFEPSTHQILRLFPVMWAMAIHILSNTQKGPKIIHKACVKPSPSVCLSDSHRERFLMCACISSLQRQRLPAARFWQCQAVKLPEQCAQRCHGNKGLQDWLTHTRVKHILSLFSPHAHSHRRPTAERCNGNTEEPA